METMPLFELTWEEGRGQRSGFLHSPCLGALSLDDEIGLTTFGIVGMRLDTLGAPNTLVISK